MLKQLIPVLALFALFYGTTEGVGIEYVTGNLRKFVELGQALKYGDNCSWEAEEYRQNFTNNRLLSGGIPSMQTVMEMVNTIVDRDYRLCSAAELFICDKESLKCVCGDPSFEALKGVNRSLYVLEGNNKCRWNINTYCGSEDSLASTRRLGFVVDSKCKLGTSCKFGDGDMCSDQGTDRYILRNHGFGAITSPRRIAEEIMSGKICSCQADEVGEDSTENEIDSWDSADSPSASRRKRSISEIQAGMLAKYATGTTIAF